MLIWTSLNCSEYENTEVQNNLITKGGFLFAPLYLFRPLKQARREMKSLNEHVISLFEDLDTCWMFIISVCSK